jgi:predicted alpha/beta-hydrolase family hydrolase
MTEQPWQILVRDGDPDRVVLILPGQGYSAQGALLWYAATALTHAGWTVRTFVWDRPANGRAEAEQVYGQVVRDDVASTSATYLVVGKSLGTLVLPLALELGLPGVWLTPLLSAHGTREVREAAAALGADGAPPALLVGGTADGLWDSDVARASGAEVLEVLGADHSMEVAGDWRRSLEVLGRVTAAVESFATGL